MFLSFLLNKIVVIVIGVVESVEKAAVIDIKLVILVVKKLWADCEKKVEKWEFSIIWREDLVNMVCVVEKISQILHVGLQMICTCFTHFLSIKTLPNLGYLLAQ